MNSDFHSGLVALLGRPNVGKSTLLNRLVGHKISIISHRPQTTRHRIAGIKNNKNSQVVYVDTPGLHHVRKGAMNRYLNKTARASIDGVDSVVLMITAKGWVDEDDLALQEIKKLKIPVILVINKVDRLDGRGDLLPLIESSTAKAEFVEIIPLSALKGENVERLEQIITKYLPRQPALYPAEQLTDKNDRFLAAERIREQVFSAIGQEVPYAVAIDIEQFEEKQKLIRIQAIIWVEKPGQKAIIIGKAGEQLKSIGTRARLEMEQLYNKHVYLNLWVKVRKGWSGNEQQLKSLGYDLEQ